MVKLLLILILVTSGALADLVAPAQPQLLIDSAPAAPAVALDLAD
ncbi:MAG TPA: hypothetical protein VEK82_06930 [Stellaceae bacterium]|nr:hypothetical protein [Stellaceae bacterium]